MAFRIRSQKVKDILGNFKNIYQVSGTLKDYRGEEIMTQIHCLTCPVWSELAITALTTWWCSSRSYGLREQRSEC
jgi:hypothetical protein